MPWWLPLYVLVLIASPLVAWGAGRRFRPPGLVLLDLAVHAALVFLSVGFYAPHLVDHWGRGVGVLFLGTLVGLGSGSYWDIALLPRFFEALGQPPFHRRGALIESILGSAMVTPGIVLGALLALRTW